MNLPTKDIDDVADGVKSIETNTYWQHNLQDRQGPRKPKIGERSRGIGCKEIIVFEEGEDCYIYSDACRQGQLPSGALERRDQMAGCESVDRHEHHQQAKAPIPSCVEQVARDTQQPFPGPFVRKHPVERIDRAEEG